MKIRLAPAPASRIAGLALPALLLLSLLCVCGCHNKNGPAVQASEPVAVQAAVAEVRTQPFHAAIAFTGTLVSTARVDIKAETTGRVVRFDKQEGDRVGEGEPLVWVDDENCRLALLQAESQVKVAEAALERTRVLETHAASERERARNLVKSGGITDRDLKAAEVAEQDAHAQAALAAAQLQQARTSVDMAKKRLRDTVIRAPVAGEIQRKFLNAGAYVEPPTPLFTLVDNSRLELESPLASADLGTLRAGQSATFTVNSYPGLQFEGKVIEVNPAVDAETRSARVRIQVHNPAGKLRAGMFAQGEILTGVNAQAVVIPAGAVYRDDRSAKESFVFVVEDGKAARRGVTIGREAGRTLEIVAGLKAGDLLITEQSIELAEGVLVAARPQQAPAGTGR